MQRPEDEPYATPAEDQTDTGRLEAFSDGVFAVAITLLALGIAVPTAVRQGGLAGALLDHWPNYLAYALSFLTILVMWINHHRIFTHISRTDHFFLVLNGILLLVVTLFPFATDLLANYITDSNLADRKAAQIVYAGLTLLLAVIYNRMWAYAIHNKRLLDPAANAQLVSSVTRQYAFGPPVYLIAFVLAFVNADVSLAICIGLAVFFVLPSSITRRLSS